MTLHLKSFSLSILTLATVMAIAVMPSAVNAHGEAGLTFSATSTTEDMPPYIVDVDYSDIVVEAGRIGRFEFNLFADAERTRGVDFTDMWVRISRNNGKRDVAVFAGGIAKQIFGGDGFSYIFPESGTYTLSIRYNDANKGTFGETVAEAQVPIEVLRSEDENTFNFTSVEFLVGIISGLFAALLGLLPLLMRKKNAR